MEKRLLKANEINCRVQQISEKGLSLLLYVTSRAGENILDELYGPLGWKREHDVIEGNLYCTISVWNDKIQQWVSKQDVGKESYTEKEKGQASDSFKRACVNWGIGRELYSAPFIWIDAKSAGITVNKNGKAVTKSKFYVKSISYDANCDIDELTIVNDKMETVYKKFPSGKIDTIKLKLIMFEAKRTGTQVHQINERCGIDKITDMTNEQFPKIYAALKKSSDKVR